ncbi:MAG TPA: amidohydrolase family protein, partial [Phycisphaerales bacterium]|nr:amidohydrolase family protein [Phycisphaerales bacterium]
MNSSSSLRDAHLHIAQLGEELSHLNLADCRSLDDALQRLASVARHSVPGSSSAPSPSGRGLGEGYPPSPVSLSFSPSFSCPRASSPAPQASPWLIAAGARAESWPERRLPTARELHEASGGAAVIIRSFDHHSIAVSARVIELANITRDTPDPAYGVIDRNPATREPTGLLLEKACDLIWRILPTPSLEARINHIRAALAELARHNLTEL